MANPKITLSAGISPIEGAVGTYLITLDTPAPAGGLMVFYNTTGSTATLNGDYNFTAGENLTDVTDNSFTISAGVTTATFSLSAHTDKIIDSNEKVVINLAVGSGYDLVSTAATFVTQTKFTLPEWAKSIISADFNGDSNADFATADYYGNTISVRLGDGNGGFYGTTEVVAGSGPTSIISADFNNDGKADLATANSYGTISVRLGDGSGGFTRTTEVAVSKYSESIISADFNNDGKADLATANSFNNTISVRLGNGSGGFTGTTEVEVGLGRYSDTTPVSIISTDFNNDGKADLATANRDSDTISVRLGDGNGGFYGTTEVVAGLAPESIISADFNNDGKADLATANGSGLSVSVRLGDGSGGFTGTTEVEVGSDPVSIISADFNGDGKADLATANLGDNSVSVHLGNGSGGFTGNIPVAVYRDPTSIISADFNNDGKADLATTHDYSDNISILLNTSSSSVALTIADVAPPVNHSPALIGTYAILTNGIEDTTYTINASNLLQGFSDIDGDTLSIANLVVNNGVLIDNTNATWTFTPSVNYNGAIALTYNVIDGNGGSIAATQNFALTAMDDVPTGTVTINDTTPEQNQTLIASNTLVDADGLGIINYLWQANGVDLVTANSYTLTSNEVGKTIQVIASYTDNFGHVESVSSASSSVVVAANHLPTGTVIISDTSPEQNQALTVSNTLTDADGLGVISYTWLANGVNVGIGNNHTVTSNEVGKTIQVIASYTDGLGKMENVSSVATLTVTDIPVNLPAGVSIIGADLITSEQGDTAEFKVKLNLAPLRDVAIDFTSSDTSEGVITNSTLKFTSTNWSDPQLLIIKGVDDAVSDGNVSYQISAAVSTIDINYKLLTVTPLELTNIDNDVTVTAVSGKVIYGDVSGSAADYITSGSADNQSGDGADTIYGLNMPDDLSGGLGNDTIYGGLGSDNLFGEDGNDYLWGNEDADYMDGGTGDDILDGGIGVDTMIGGTGNDTYYLGYDAKDIIVDKGPVTDIDTIVMPYELSNYTLPSVIENASITNGIKGNLTGNVRNNTLIGNDSNNNLYGAAGLDSLSGGAGNDVLVGGTGNDTLSGGTGNDIFKFNTALVANIDKITDFVPVEDTIQLENRYFNKLMKIGVLNAANFVTSTSAVDSNDYLIYNQATGALLYDADGSGMRVGVQIALLGVNLALTNADFVII